VCPKPCPASSLEKDVGRATIERDPPPRANVPFYAAATRGTPRFVRLHDARQYWAVKCCTASGLMEEASEPITASLRGNKEHCGRRRVLNAASPILFSPFVFGKCALTGTLRHFDAPVGVTAGSERVRTRRDGYARYAAAYSAAQEDSAMSGVLRKLTKTVVDTAVPMTGSAKV